MSRIQDVIADPLALTVVPNRQPQKGVKRAKSNFVAIGLVTAGLLPAFGTSFTPPGGTAAVLTSATLPDVIKSLCYAAQATFLGNGEVNGKRGKFSEFMESFNYGTRTKNRPTGFGEITYSFDNLNQYVNAEFFNQLRSAQTPYDIFVFTDSSVEIIRWADHNPVYMGIGTSIDGDIKKDIPGSFDIAVTTEGEIPPVFGIPLAKLVNDVRFLFTAPTVTGLVVVAGAVNTFSLASVTAGVLTPVLAQADTAAGLSYSLFLNATDDLGTLSASVTINSATGVVSIASGLTTGNYRFTIVVQNTTGVIGSYTFTVQKA